MELNFTLLQLYPPGRTLPGDNWKLAWTTNVIPTFPKNIFHTPGIDPLIPTVESTD
jgi:hypothetical protein